MTNGGQHMEEQYWDHKRLTNCCMQTFSRLKSICLNLTVMLRFRGFWKDMKNLKRASHYKLFPIYLSPLCSFLNIHVGLEVAAFTAIS